MNKLIKAANGARGRIVLASAALMSAASAHAEGVDISAAVTAAKTDIGTAGGLIIGVVVAVAAFSWIRRVIK
jgi:hypothetical protein